MDFWSDIDLSAGESFGDVIETHLEGAKAVLVCWSPEAAPRPWVKAEAMYASDLGTYVPIFVARCELKLQFNGVHTEDLSHWKGARDDPAWLKLVARLAEKIGREGVAAAARALAQGDEAAKYAFARRYPDEPLARTIWASAETRLRAEFAARLAEARAALEARVSAEAPAFEACLAEERRGAANGPKPDPLAVMEAKAGAERALRERVEALSSALAKAKAREDQFDQANAEVERLKRELATARAGSATGKNLRERVETLSSALAQAEARTSELDKAKADVVRLTNELASARMAAPAPAKGARTWALLAIVAVLALALVELLVRDAGAPTLPTVAQLQTDLGSAKRAASDAEAIAAKLRDELSASQAQAQAGEAAGEKKLYDANASLAAANDQIATLHSYFAASQNQALTDAGTAKSAICAPLAPLASRPPEVLSAAEECGLKPKDTFRECADCPTMVVVPAGSFAMGSPESEPGRDSDEGPRHEVHISKAFAVGAFTVTFDEWDACDRDGGCGRYVPDDNSWGRGRRPVINVSWNDAQNYVEWLSRKTGKPYRLLSESEWEYSARAGTTTPFWQGATISPSQANYDGTQSYNGGAMGEYRKQPVSVGSFPPNPFGLYDMNGNVWQLVADCYREAYRDLEGTEAPSDGSEWKATGNCSDRALRGGSWLDDPRELRSAFRSRLGPNYRYNIIGFRLARTFPP